MKCFQVDGEDICDLVKRYNDYKAGKSENFTLPPKEDLAKMLKSIGGNGRGLKTQEHYMKKVMSAIQEKCHCVIP